jgi:amino acid adenylation domain-containing protein
MIELLNKLRDQNILVEVVDGKLKVFAKDPTYDSGLIAEIRERKGDLLKFLMEQSALDGIFQQQIPTVPQAQNYLASSSQQMLWVVSQFEEANTGYNIPGVYGFEGALDLPALERSFTTLIGRHESLRTVFGENEQGELCQFILPAEQSGFRLEQLDLRGYDDVQGRLDELVRRVCRLPFSLSRGPLLRAHLYQVEENRWVFVYVMHHIISDGWSMEVLIRELLVLYQAFSRGKDNPLPPLPIQYKDYSAWHRKQLEENSQHAHKQYWLEHFEGELPVLELPSSRVRPLLKTYNGGLLSYTLSGATSQELQTLSNQQGATLFMGLMAAVHVFLYRYTGQSDIIIGTPVAGRQHADLEDQIGFYVNTLALRTVFDGQDSYLELLDKVKKVVSGAYEHQVYPFAELVEALQLQRDMSRNPLFDIQVILGHDTKNDAGMSEGLENLKISGYEGDRSVTSRFDIVFNFIEVGEELLLNIVYNPDIYSPGTMEQMGNHLLQIMEAIASEPLKPISRLDYLTAGEKSLLLDEYGRGQSSVPLNGTILDLFREQVQKHPGHPAVVFEEAQLGYRELDEQSDKLAYHLKQVHGIQPGDLVGIMVDRSEKMLTGILAILKAGGAYVPIDPAYPDARKEFIIRDTRAKVLVTQSDYIFDLPYYEGTLFAADIELDMLEAPASSFKAEIKPSSLAYVIYTSGSTGQPKGVLVEHGNLMHSIGPRLVTYSGAGSFLLLSSIAFDSSVAGIFGTLCSGGTLHIAKKTDVADVALLAGYIEANKITQLLTVPSYYRLLLGELEQKTNFLRRVIVAGETCPASLVEQHHQAPALQDCELFNEYGPTEATVWSTVHKYRRGEAIVQTIGSPIANTNIYILDEAGELVPAGVTGEICIGGNGVARGYLNQDNITAAKFVPDPFVPGKRMYRTGDTGRWRKDGLLEFIGRKDNQVKIRGYRIEPGEVEAALQKYPSIGLALVIPRITPDGSSELVAYVTGAGVPPAAELQDWLSTRVPAFALPAYYIHLKELPLTPNGKVDRKRLPDPGAYLTANTYVPPGNEIEEQMILIWQQVLGREKIGITDGLFELGGDSIKILKLASEVKKKMRLYVPVADFYKNNTIGQLADFISRNREVLEDKAESLKELEAEVRLEMEALKEHILSSGTLADTDNIEDVFPMTDIEKGMVYASLLDRNSGIYHDQMVRQRRFASFDFNRFRHAMELLVKKHQILRTAFNIGDYEASVQIVYKAVKMPMYYEDLSGISQEQQEEAVRTLMSSSLADPFDVGLAPLWRMNVFNLGNGQLVFVFQCHHAIIDGWSDAMLMTELNNLYLQLQEEPSYEPPMLKLGYKDFVVQHEMDKKDEAIRKFWQRELSGYKRLDLFGNRSIGEGYSRVLQPDQLAKLEKVAKELGVTIKVLSLSAYLYMLTLLDNEPDVVAGVVTNTRPGTEHGDQVLGCFLNTLPFRMEIAGNLSCRELVSRVSEKLVSLKPYERLSLLEIAGLHKERMDSGNPFFDTFFNYVDFHAFDAAREDDSPAAGEDVNLSLNNRGQTNTYFDFLVNATGNSYTVSFNLRKELKPGLSARRIGNLYFDILRHITEAPAQSLASLDIVSEEEKRLLAGFNDTAVDYPRDKTLVCLFEEQVDRSPQHMALVFEDKELTYKELNEQANQLAQYLRSNYGLQPDDLVGVKLERSEWMVIALLGVLKSGAAYVPIDPGYPQERIDYIVLDSNCKLVIDEELLGSFVQEANEYSSENLTSSGLQPSHLAYVIYTSGSTGKPKGCMLEHRGVVNRLAWMHEHYSYTSDDIILQKTTFTFDVSVWELFLPLCWGMKMVLCHKDDIASPERIAHLIEEQQVTCLHFVPSMFNAFISLLFEEENIAGRLKSLRLVITSGEALMPATVQGWYRKMTAPVHNLYGPTEASVDVTYYAASVGDRMIPIGRPIWNTQIYILNDQTPVPPGVTGEICIAGEGLARGYLNKPELTAEKFVANLFYAGKRMYRTGDMGRWLPDGNIEYLGRMDHQVKIRGYRIELGEIEDALQSAEGVEAAVAMAKTSATGEKELVAYLAGNGPIEVQKLRTELGRTLPAYMIPEHFVQLDKLPLTYSGKVDRKALPDPEGLGLSTGVEYVAPRTETEEKLAVIWQEVLGKGTVGVKDNFFELGGHSLKAIRLVSQIHKKFDVKLRLQDLFGAMVLEDQALLIARSARTFFANIQSVEPQEDYVLSSPQRRLWVLSQFEEGNTAYNMPGVFVFEGALNTTAFASAFDALIGRHEILRTVFRENARGEIRQFILSPAEMAFSINWHDLRSDSSREEKIKQMVHEEATCPLNLADGPLIKASLYRVEDNQWVFTYVLHHIISDGWSMSLLTRELLLLYNAFAEGKTAPLAPLRIQYKDYATWQQEQLGDELLNGHRSYWLKQFEGEIPVLELAGDHPRPTTKSYRGAVISRRFGPELNNALKALAKQQDATLYMGLLAAVNVLLYRYTSQEDVIVGSPIAGRQHADLEDQIGFYVNMLALRTRLQGSEDFSQLLSRVKQGTLEAYEHQVYPFDELVEEVHLSGDTSRHPLFDVVVVLQNTEIDRELSTTELQHVKLRPYEESKRVVSLFDLRFDFREMDGELIFGLEYNSDIYNRERMERMADNFGQLIHSILEHPSQSIDRLEYITASEKLLLSVAGTPASYPANATVVSLFEEQVERTPHHTAIAFEDQTLSYEKLNERANRVAHFLLNQAGLKTGEGVGILLNRSPECVIAILGILKAGGMYIPMETDTPEDRLRFVVMDTKVRVVITEKALIELLNRLQWSCSCLDAYLCVDSTDVHAEKEREENPMMSQELWDHVGEKAVDQITGGGWSSSFTGQPIPAGEMEEYAMNAYRKLAGLLHSGMRVLEIGCSSGLTLSKIAPQVELYYGTDMSPVILENTGQMVEKAGLTNVQLKRMVAHETGSLEESFDLIIINSVIQHFHGHNYLRKVIAGSVGLLKDKGMIFIGDVMDMELKDQLLHDLGEFQVQNKGKGYTTKTDFSADLFVAKGFFEDLITDQPGIAGVEIGGKIRTIENELTLYRYDAILQVDKNSMKDSARRKNKHQYDSTILDVQPVHNPQLPIRSSDLAYIIYTSGTTGRPKGSLIEHRNVVRLFMTDKPLFHFSEQDVWTLFHSYSFDFSVWEMYGALLFGGKLVIVPSSTAKDPSLFRELLLQHNVTVLNQTPSAFYNLIREELENEALGLGIRYVIFGGEALSPGKLAGWRKRYPQTELINMYGITETTVHVTYKRLSDEDIAANSSNIGHPIPTLTCYVLDQNQQLLPIGVWGELYVGGEGVCRGYLNRDELTAQRFLSSPFKTGERLYRTGDKARLMENGGLEYGGRIDGQVKVRGYRIELGEIEHMLEQHSDIESAVVMARIGKEGEKELVAYVVGRETLSSADLSAYLGKTLPAFMLPSHYVQLDSLPLTVNGKVNRKALPDPEGLNMSSGVDYIAPRNETEQKMVLIWQEVLGREHISVKDNFFDLGGHSLKATRLASQIHKRFDVKLKLKDLFEVTVLEDQSRLIEQSARISFALIKPVEPQEDYVLSSSQRRLWILSQFEESNIAYNIPGVHVFEGTLDTYAFASAFAALIERHEILRTVFREDAQGDVRQFILSPAETGFSITWHDLRSDSSREERIRQMVHGEIMYPFNLAAGPLVKASVYRVKEEQWVFTYVMHHIISDGWSMDILIRELLALYNAFAEGKTASLSPLRIQYKDYATWQQQQLQGKAFEAHRHYWLKQFEGDLPVLQMPSDHRRPAIKTYNGGSVNSNIGASLGNRIKALCSGEGGTLFMGLLAAVNTLLYRYSHQEDIIIGSPIAGREHADLEDQIGFYVNTLALRTRFSGSGSFRELLQNVKQLTLDAYSHQSYPFEELVEGLQLQRDMSRSALFDVMVVLQNTGSGEAGAESLGNIEVKEYSGSRHLTSKFDLLFTFAERGEEIGVALEYNSDIYSKGMAERLTRHLVQLLEAIVEQPSVPISAIEYLADIEREQLLVQFNDTAVDYPRDKTITCLFEEQVERTPGAIALVFGDKELTYKELNETANQLAHYLRNSYELQPDDLVGVLLERSEWMIITLLGVLKSGAAYVPIDPGYPQERIGYMTADSGCKLVVDEEELEKFRSAESLYGSSNPVSVSRPSDLAYVIYTSGTTGKPKGSLIEHRNVVRLFKTDKPLFDFDEKDVWTVFHSFCFDFSVWEMYGALLFGGKAVVVSKAVAQDTAAYRQFLLQHKVTVLNQTPSAFYNLMREELEYITADLQLRYVIFGGEALSPGRLKEWKEKYAETRLVNMYGITETTVHVTYKEITQREVDENTSNIGIPIPTLSCYVLDQRQQLLPAGVWGELYVGGEGVCRSYLNRPELTAQRFISSPFKTGERLYRSGDRVRLLENGELEYGGRNDEQVKVRGYRIELGEIESVLQGYPAVSSCIVIAKAFQQHGKELVAYLTGEQQLNAAELVTWLGRSLPDYMIPTYYVQLEKLPLTSNGKVDRMALPEPQGLNVDTGIGYVAPRNATEERLALLWSSILEVPLEKTGVKDNFFHLGGHSLKATRLLSKIEKEFGTRLLIRDLFAEPTIEAIAARIERLLWVKNDGQAPQEEDSETESMVF